MTYSSDQWRDLDLLLDRILDGLHVEEDMIRLNNILHTDTSACRHYISYIALHGRLIWEYGARIEQKGEDSVDGRQPGLKSVAQELSPVARVGLPLQLGVQHSESSIQSFTPTPGFPSSTIHAPVGYLSGWPVAYLIATVIFGIGALIGVFTYVSQPTQVAQKLSPTANERVASAPETQLVGRITGMVDCKWSDPQNAPVTRFVCLDQTYALVSGLMEITYDNGAKVILQGPMTYKATSTNSGYLSVGKLTARVEKRGAEREERGEGQAVHHSSNSQSRIPNPPLFTIKTPTAIVTDLGTEFGVEVDDKGGTISHVYRGSVRVTQIDDRGNPKGKGHVLHENESMQVEYHDGQYQITKLPALVSSTFVRGIPKQTIKILDLVDVVAGGDGFSGRRGRGINPSTGQPATNAQASPLRLMGDYKYHRTEANPFVDGVFIPDGSRGPVQIDLAGHTFNDFGTTLNSVTMNIWAGGPVVAGGEPRRLRTELGGVEYAAPGHGLIFLAANAAITFDLDAIRKANPNRKLLRFRAVVGNTEMKSQEKELKHAIGADIWVFVDGVLQYRRRNVIYSMGAFSVNLALGNRSRFLTLVSTDGGSGTWNDWTMFGDPRLEYLETTPASNQTKGDPMGP